MTENWIEIAKGFIPAIPGYEFLEQSEFDGLAYKNALKTALATAMYRIKNGTSVCLALPVTHPDSLRDILQYLHACRIDTMHGLVRAGWYNSFQMVMLPDLLVWTKASLQIKILKNDRQLRPQHIGLNRETRSLKKTVDDDGRIARTIVCQTSDDIQGFVADLSKYIHPFLIVIDMTVFGYSENPAHLAELMEEYFSGCPMLFLANSGDLVTTQSLQHLPNRYQFWHQHIFDETLFGQRPSKSRWKFIQVEVPDKRLNDYLIDALGSIKALKNSLPAGNQLNALTILSRVLNALQVLAIPYEMYDSLLNQKRRGGLYPVKPLNEWLTMAKRERMTTGQAQIELDNTIHKLQRIIELVKTGRTGKYLALKKWVDQCLKKNETGLICVGTLREADNIRSWLLCEYVKAFNNQQIQVLGLKSYRDRYKIQQMFDQAIMVGKVWKDDYWSLFLAKTIFWLSYPGESHWDKQNINDFFRVFKNTDTQKMNWWMLTDNVPDVSSLDDLYREEQTWGDCSGEYRMVRNVQLDIPSDPSKLVELFKEFHEKTDASFREDALPPGDVMITTEEGGHYRFDQTDIIEIVENDNNEVKISRIQAGDIQEGQKMVILLDDKHQEFSLFDSLVDFIIEDSNEHKTYELLAQRWFDYLDNAFRKYKNLTGLQKKLKSENLIYHDATIKNWLDRKVMGPKDKEKVIPVLAKISDIEFTQADLNGVINSIKRMLGLHILIGKLIQEAIRADIEQVDEIKINNKTIAVDDLKALYMIKEVFFVTKNDSERIQETVNDLVTVLKNAAQNSQGKLTFTAKALKSAQDSLYNDYERADRCLYMMTHEFYEVWAHGSSLEQAIQIAQHEGIEYRGDSSDKTKGKYPHLYFRNYNGKKIDIGKHLNMGNSRDPKHCLRVHYHFDESRNQVVIHHFGRHLPVASG